MNFSGDKPGPNTMAGLVVQTPQKGSGGYGLAINNTGYWELVDSNRQRQASGRLTTSRTNFSIELKVQEGKLYGLIDGEPMFRYNDIFAPSQDAIGLIIYGSKSLSSVYFSDFELDL